MQRIGTSNGACRQFLIND